MVAGFQASCLMLVIGIDTCSTSCKTVVGKRGSCLSDCWRGNMDDKPCSQKLLCVLVFLGVQSGFVKDQTGGKSAFRQL